MPHTRVNLAAGAPVASLGFKPACTRADTRRCAGDAPALPSAAALSDELKNATQDVEAVLREDRQLERQRDFRGVLGVFQVWRLCAAGVTRAPAASALTRQLRAWASASLPSASPSCCSWPPSSHVRPAAACARACARLRHADFPTCAQRTRPSLSGSCTE